MAQAIIMAEVSKESFILDDDGYASLLVLWQHYTVKYQSSLIICLQFLGLIISRHERVSRLTHGVKDTKNEASDERTLFTLLMVIWIGCAITLVACMFSHKIICLTLELLTHNVCRDSKIP